MNLVLSGTRHINISNPLDKENEVWAVCYIGRKGDAENKCTLTRDELMITRKARLYCYPVNHIKSVYLEKRKLLLPIIVGGILSPLTLLAIYENMFSPGILLLLFFAGLFILYYGWSGTMALIIQTADRAHYIFITNDTEHLTRFIAFSNTLIKSFNETTGEFYFYILRPDKNNQNIPDFTEDRDEHILYTRKEILDQPISAFTDDTVVLTITPLKLVNMVKLKKISDKVRFVTKSVNKSCILKTQMLKDFKSTA